MRRRAVGMMSAAIAALVLAGCPAAPPPPPPGWTPPVVTATVASDPVQAGEPFTVEVDAVHADPIQEITLQIEPPVGVPSNPMFSEVTCEGAPFSPAPVAARSFTCQVPGLAPNGDDWRLTAYARSSSAPSYRGQVHSTFTVAGGSDDRSAPVLVSAQVSPRPVLIGQPFTITFRVADANHRPPQPTPIGRTIVIPAPPVTTEWGCSPATPTPVSATELEWRFTDCLIPVGASQWTYAAGIGVTDELGYRGYVSLAFPAVTG